jgi:protein ImuB
VVLSRSVHQVETVVALCERAERAGVTIGMTVAHARALLPSRGVLIEPLDHERTSRSLRKLAAWSIGMVPVVAADEPDGLLCDVTGCERLYRSIARLARMFLARVQGLGVAARVAAAPSYGAAWALARHAGRSPAILEPGRVRAGLAELPVRSLRIEPEIVESLRRVGVVNVGHLLALSRASIADRYGSGVLLRMDQAFGDARETIRPVRVRPPVHAEQVFDGPTDRLDTVLFAARTVLARVADELARRESGCRRLELLLDRSDMDALSIHARTAKPTRDARHLWSLLAPKVESAHLGFGVQGVRLLAGGVVRLAHEQGHAWAREQSRQTLESVARLVDILNARFGAGRVMRLVPVHSHLPERSLRFDPVVDLDAIEPLNADATLANIDRPSLLYDEPRRVDVLLLVPDGPVASVLHRGESRRVVASLGPERIEPEWWRRGGSHTPRDYYKVLTDDGRVLWVFREPRGEWFLHGVWA